MAAVPKVKLNNGLEMPAIGLGTWMAKPAEAENIIKAAIDAGYRHIDTALIYSNEKAIGNAIREKIADGTVKREELFITSKLWNTYHEPDLVIKGCKKTLRNLGLDYVDLYLIHWPIGFKGTDKAEEDTKEFSTIEVLFADPEFFPRNSNGEILFSDNDYVNTWKEMEKCVQLGLAKSIGISNFNSQQVERILQHATIKPVTNQVECHPYFNQKKLNDFCRQRDIIITAYSPLGSQNPVKPGLVKIVENPKILQIAKDLGRTPAQIILRYLIQQNVVPIPKSSNPSRMKENLAVFDFSLTSSQVAEIDSLNINERLVDIPGTESHKDYMFKIEF